MYFFEIYYKFLFFIYFQDKEGKKKSRNKEGKIQQKLYIKFFLQCFLAVNNECMNQIPVMIISFFFKMINNCVD